MMSIRYPVLAREIKRRGIRKCAISQSLNINCKSLESRLRGFTPFTWEEACVINRRFFPDMDKTALFAERPGGSGRGTGACRAIPAAVRVPGACRDKASAERTGEEARVGTARAPGHHTLS